MALKYEIKEMVFGFDKTKTAQFVARPVSAGEVSFSDLCDQVTKVGMAPRGVVKMVLDGLIDVMEMNMKNGMKVKLGDFGSFKTSFGSSAQETSDKVSAQILKNRKILFCPGAKLKEMIKAVSIQRVALSDGSGSTVVNPGTGGTGTGDSGTGGTGTGGTGTGGTGTGGTGTGSGGSFE